MRVSGRSNIVTGNCEAAGPSLVIRGQVIDSLSTFGAVCLILLSVFRLKGPDMRDY